MLVFALSVSGRPPDEGHPYGHGKAEFLSAAIEGAAIAFAALIIITESVRELLAGPSLQRLDIGIAVLAATTVANAALGMYLVRVGRRVESAALTADGRHVLTDVWTSAGVIVALFVVHWTGWLWADPLVAIAVALNVAWEGYRLIQEALGGLMDEADPEVLEEVTSRLESARAASWIDLHGLRSWRSGARRHVDLHLTVPRYFDVDEIHEIHDRVEAALLGDTPGDVVVHFDPCVASLCRACGVEGCPIRSAARTRHFPFTAERAVRTDEQLGHHTSAGFRLVDEARA
jgi:cation diffusion facilitator family transporter